MRGRASVVLVAIVLLVVGAFDGAADPSIARPRQSPRRCDAIRAHFHVARGVEIDAAALDAALKELYATGAFEDVKIARSGAQVIVTVVEAPVVGRLQFEGNRRSRMRTSPRWPL